MSGGREIDVGLTLLDRQVLDSTGVPVGKVDDVELTYVDPDSEAPSITALLLGPVAYWKRIGGRVGVALSGTADRLSGGEGPIRVPMEIVKEIGVSIVLVVGIDELNRVHDLETWLSEHFIGRIPGAGHAP
jgi:sporulation protein YlmC with PRC-barrel domain